MRNHDLKNLVNLVEDLTNYICAIYVYQLHYVRTEHLKLNAVCCLEEFQGYEQRH